MKRTRNKSSSLEKYAGSSYRCNIGLTTAYLSFDLCSVTDTYQMIGSITSSFGQLCHFPSYRLTNPDSTSTLHSISEIGDHVLDMRSVDRNKEEIPNKHVSQVALFPQYDQSKYQDMRPAASCLILR